MSPGAEPGKGQRKRDRGGGEPSDRGPPDVLYLVRHAKSLPRHSTPGPDVERSLSPAGLAQAKALPKRFGRDRSPAVARVLTSPAMRCRQTVTPLAESLGLTTETVVFLCEGTDPQMALEALAGVAAEAGRARPPGSVVACTHGDVMTGIVEIAAASVDLVNETVVAKGSTWVLELEGGKVVGARYIPPP